MLRKTIGAVVALLALAAIAAAPAMALEKVNLTSNGEQLHSWFTMRSTGIKFHEGAIEVSCGSNANSVYPAENPGAKVDLDQAVLGEECETNGLGYKVKAYLKPSQAPLALSIANSTEGNASTNLALGVDYYSKGERFATCEYSGAFSQAFKFGSQLSFSLGQTFTKVTGSSGLCGEAIYGEGSFSFEREGKAVLAGTTLVKGLFRNTESGPVAVKAGEGIQATSSDVNFTIGYEGGYKAHIRCDEALLSGEAYAPASSPAVVKVNSASLTDSEGIEGRCATEGLLGATAAVSLAGESGIMGMEFNDAAGGPATGQIGPLHVTVNFYIFGGVLATCTYKEVWGANTSYAFEENLGLSVSGPSIPMESATTKLCGLSIEPSGEFAVSTTGASHDPIQVMAG